MIKVDPTSIDPLNRANRVILVCDNCGSVLTIHSTEGFDVDQQGNCIDTAYLAGLERDLSCEKCLKPFKDRHVQWL